MSAMSATTPTRRAFGFFYTGEFIAITGMEFATYSVWIFIIGEVGFPLWLKISAFLWYMPFLIASPFAGSLVDRWGARRAMVVASIAGALNFLALALLAGIGLSTTAPALFVCAMYFAVSLKTLHLAAFDAAIPFLVPKESLGKANGMRMVVTAGAAILGVTVSGPLLGAVGLYGVVAMGCLCYGFALFTLRSVSIAKPSRTAAETAGGSLLGSLLTEFGWACRYVASRRGLASLLLVAALVHVALSSSEALWNQMALPFASDLDIALGAVSAAAGITLGTVLMMKLGTIRRLADIILGSAMLLAGAMVLGSLRPHMVLLSVAAFLLLASTPPLIGSVMTLMQLKVPPGMLGRTAAMRNLCICAPFMVTRITSLVVVIPLLGDKDVDSPWLGAVVGTGTGRGLAAVTLVIGLVLAACFVAVYRRSSLRSLEQSFPDVTPEDLVSAAPQPDQISDHR